MSIAEDMIDGTACDHCGIYFDDEGEGYPRICQDCFDDLPYSDERESYKHRIGKES